VLPTVHEGFLASGPNSNLPVLATFEDFNNVLLACMLPKIANVEREVLVDPATWGSSTRQLLGARPGRQDDRFICDVRRYLLVPFLLSWVAGQKEEREDSQLQSFVYQASVEFRSKLVDTY
jgi:hypothetical protein